MCSIERWITLCHSVGATTQVAECYHALIARYAEPPRAYHNITHVAHCLAEFDVLADEADHPQAVELAIWFHDAVYDTRRTDNEEQSASFAAQTLACMGIESARGDFVQKLILLTRHVETPVTRDGQIIVDVDLAILASPPQAFDVYEARIRQEYGWVDDILFWTKRREFLVSMLNRSHIFHTVLFRTRYEDAARHNLQRAIAHAERQILQG